MSSRWPTNPLRSVKVRLTLTSAVFFALVAVFAFYFLSYSVRRVIIDRVDAELMDELNEFRSIYRDGGFEALCKELHLEEQVHRRDQFLACVYSIEGEIIAATDLASWEPAAYGVDDIPGLLRGEPIRESLDLGIVPLASCLHKPHCTAGILPAQLRRICGRLTESSVVVLGFGLGPHLSLSIAFRNLFAVVLGLMLALSILGAWFVASRAMVGVEAMTHTARRIADGELQQRVATSGHGEEIDRLAETFNAMLDRIEALVAEMKAVNDNIAHELRSPITRIRGTAEVTLLRDASVEEFREVTGSIVEECDTLLSLANGMLDISEMEAGVTRLKIGPVDVMEMVQDIRDLFSPVAEDRGIEIEMTGPERAVVAADPRKLHQALANLVDNALKYTPAGGRVSIGVLLDESDLRVTVADTGIGIPEEDLPHVFDRFYRCARSRSEPGSGLGLGLAKAIVKAHGGAISAESTVGEGTLFTVTLPRK